MKLFISFILGFSVGTIANYFLYWKHRSLLNERSEILNKISDTLDERVEILNKRASLLDERVSQIRSQKTSQLN